jgi:hypothetical protein
MQKNKKIKMELKSKTLVLKQLEGVYKTSSNTNQKKRVLNEIEEIKLEIQNLKGKLIIYGFDNDEWQTEDIDDEEGIETFILLSKIAVPRYREDSKDREMDAVISYEDFFEKNYLSILSEYYLKLDFNNSAKRDIFYPKFMEIKKVLKEYDYELDILNREEYNNIAHYRDKSVIHKIRQRYLLLLDKYFKDLRKFLELLIDDFKTGGTIILNPLEYLSLSEFDDNRRLEGYNVIETLKEMYTFCDEFTRFLSMPNI